MLQTIRVPDDVRDQLRLLAAITEIDEEEHLRRAMRGYLETSGRKPRSGPSPTVRANAIAACSTGGGVVDPLRSLAVDDVLTIAQ